MPRPGLRANDALREVRFHRGYTRQAAGSVLVNFGNTVVLCTCTIDRKVPDFLIGKNQGWLTAEYGMLPGSTNSRKARDKAGKVDGRTVEIQRLIGRSLRAVVDLSKIGERTIWLDCDVLDADGGTRTASITGAFVALVDALHKAQAHLPYPIDTILTDSIAAVSVGIVDGEERLDLEYVEDRDAAVDFNVVMTGRGQFVEVQGTGEEATFTRKQLDGLVTLGAAGIERLTALQRTALAEHWPLT